MKDKFGVRLVVQRGDVVFFVVCFDQIYIFAGDSKMLFQGFQGFVWVFWFFSSL